MLSLFHNFCEVNKNAAPKPKCKFNEKALRGEANTARWLQ